MVKRAIPSEETLLNNLSQLWKFLGAIARIDPIREILRDEGLTKEELQRGWKLANKANGYPEDSEEEAPPTPNEVGQALIEVNQTDERVFRRSTVVLQGDYPDQLAYLMRGGLSPKDGPESIFSLGTLLDRIDVLEKGSDATRADKKEEDKKAVEKLGKRGLTLKERQRLRKLIALATSSLPASEESTDAPAAPAAPVSVIDAEAERLEALVDAYYWYKEWSEIARESITRGDYLIFLGLRKRRSPKKDL